eukprot:scaffold100110_cov15-Tisochrysis_lutea.AAC.1
MRPRLQLMSSAAVNQKRTLTQDGWKEEVLKACALWDLRHSSGLTRQHGKARDVKTRKQHCIGTRMKANLQILKLIIAVGLRT